MSDEKKPAEEKAEEATAPAPVAESASAKATADKGKKEEIKTEKPKKEEEETKDVEVPKKFKSLVEEVEKMSVLDLAELVKVLEDKFGVSSAAPAMMMAPTAVGAGGDAGAAEEQTEFDVELTEIGDNKIGVIKAVKAATGLGLADAKGLVDGAPSVIKEKVAKAEAEELKKALEEAGSKVTLK